MKKRVIILITIFYFSSICSSNQADKFKRDSLAAAIRADNEPLVKFILKKDKSLLDQEVEPGLTPILLAQQLKSNGLISFFSNVDSNSAVAQSHVQQNSINNINTVQVQPNLLVPKDLSVQSQKIKFNSKTPYEKILEAKEVPSGMTVNDVKNILFEKMKYSHQKIGQDLFFRAANTHQLFGKKIAILIDHIINLYPEVGLNKKISLQGGHMYETLEAFCAQGFIEDVKFYQDPVTNCFLFDGYDIFTGQRFYKTAFPQGWTPEDIYKAILVGTRVGLDGIDDKGHLVIKVKVAYKNNPEFIVRLVLYRRQSSDVWEIMTAFPEL